MVPAEQRHSTVQYVNKSLGSQGTQTLPSCWKQELAGACTQVGNMQVELLNVRTKWANTRSHGMKMPQQVRVQSPNTTQYFLYSIAGSMLTAYCKR